MTQYAFSTGALWGERTDQTGAGIGPLQFGTAQNIQLDFDITTKALYGQGLIADVIARSQMKITGKIGFARIQGLVFSQLYFGQFSLLGQIPIAQYESAVIPSVPPFSLAVTHAATFRDDLGVFFVGGDSRAFLRATTPASTGQYTVNEASGVYTFSSVDAGRSIIISYGYLDVTVGSQFQINDTFSGVTPTFRATFYNGASPGNPSASMTLILNNCTASKLSLPAKVADWQINSIDFEAFKDANGILGTMTTTE